MAKEQKRQKVSGPQVVVVEVPAKTKKSKPKSKGKKHKYGADTKKMCRKVLSQNYSYQRPPNQQDPNVFVRVPKAGYMTVSYTDLHGVPKMGIRKMNQSNVLKSKRLGNVMNSRAGPQYAKLMEMERIAVATLGMEA